MQRTDTRKITLSGLTLTPTEGSIFQDTLSLNNVSVVPEMSNWYSDVYAYRSASFSWGQLLLDDVLQDIFVEVRVDGGQEEYGLKWRVGLFFYTDGYGYSQSFNILEQDGDTVYDNPWLVPSWNVLVPDVENEDYPWTDYLTLSGTVSIAPVSEGSFTLPFRGLSAIEVTNADPDTFYTSIGDTKTFILSGTYVFDETIGTYIHNDPNNVLNSLEVPTLYFDYDIDVEGAPAGLDFRIYKIVGPGSTSTVAEMGYLPSVLSYSNTLDDVQISDWTSFQDENFVGMTLLGQGGSAEPSNPTFGLPASVVALIESRFGSVANFLRLRNQGQV